MGDGGRFGKEDKMQTVFMRDLSKLLPSMNLVDGQIAIAEK